MSNMDEDKIVSLKQASEFLGISEETLRRYDKNGTLASMRTAGGHRRYSLLQLRRFKLDMGARFTRRNYNFSSNKQDKNQMTIDFD